MLWYIGGERSLVLEQVEQEIQQNGQYTCPNCGHVNHAAAPIFIDFTDQQKAMVYVPEFLAYRALAVQAELLMNLSQEVSLSAQAYYTNAQTVVGTQNLSQSNTQVQFDTALNSSAKPEPVKSVEAPIIAPIPKTLQNSVLESAELAQELAESPTQVIKPKAKRSKSQITSVKTTTSSLDALIDTALEDQTAINDLKQDDFNSRVTDVKEREKALEEKRNPRDLPNLEAKPEDIQVSKENNAQKTMISMVEPEEMLDQNKQEQTRRLYAQNIKRFDAKLADQKNKYINVTDGNVELAVKLSERRVESWINETLDVRIQLHRELQLGAPCLTLFTLKDG